MERKDKKEAAFIHFELKINLKCWLLIIPSLFSIYRSFDKFDKGKKWKKLKYKILTATLDFPAKCLEKSVCVNQI